METYYRLLDTKGQQDAAEANLKNAQTVQQAAEARLELGLATLPDVLEAAQRRRTSRLQSPGSHRSHRDRPWRSGDCAGHIAHYRHFKCESIQDIKMPDSIVDTVETSIDKALAQRPDLMQRVAQLRAAGAEVKSAQSQIISRP